MRRHAPSIIAPDLVAQVARGDRYAFSQLYDLSCSLLFALAQKILDETDEATELLQEVYVEIWQKAHISMRCRFDRSLLERLNNVNKWLRS